MLIKAFDVQECCEGYKNSKPINYIVISFALPMKIKKQA